MDCIEARALKSKYLAQTAMKMNSQVFYDDVWGLTGVNSGAPEDFPVEDLLNLDFPEKEFQEPCVFQEDEGSQKRNSNNSSSSFSGADEFDSLSVGELAVPVDDLENLEWLSQFVDDSTSGLSLLCPAFSFTVKTGANSGNPVGSFNRTAQKIPPPCFPLPVPGKSRSKRSRLNRRPRSMAFPPLSTADSSTTPASSNGSSTLFMNPDHDMDWFSVEEKPAKKQKKRPETGSGSASGRRCTHCQVQKTPQWRTGPLGPKTLCNACGVRFKSGRLFPEYRPACSPTFSQEMHSNSHRKVLEMRRKKEIAGLHKQAAVEVV